MRNEDSTILIVEDEPVVREAAARTLEDAGWTVEAVPGAAEAVALLDSGRFRIVLSDLMLPGDSGFEVLARCRATHPALPVVMITGYATLDLTLEGFRNGVFDFIPKPFDAGELTGVIDRAWRFSALGVTNPSASASPHRPDGGTTGTFRLGGHSWVEVDSEGAAIVGLGRTFLGTVVGARKIELPDEGEHVLQARQLAQISCDDDRIHRVWTPVSGRIMTVNHEICGDLAKDATEIHDPPWLARIAPTRLDAETPFLTDSSDRSGDDDRTEQVEGESWFSRLSC